MASGAALHTAAALALLVCSGPAAGFDAVPEEGDCAGGSRIERALGSFGYRVVVSGADRARDDRPVKVQVWENDDREWVITEAFIHRKRTCVVRTGSHLFMMY